MWVILGPHWRGKTGHRSLNKSTASSWFLKLGCACSAKMRTFCFYTLSYRVERLENVRHNYWNIFSSQHALPLRILSAWRTGKYKYALHCFSSHSIVQRAFSFSLLLFGRWRSQFTFLLHFMLIYMQLILENAYIYEKPSMRKIENGSK